MLVAGATLAGLLPSRGAAAQQGVVLAALALGMPHGAADTELLVRAADGSRARHAGLVAGYSALALASTVVVRRGGPWVERGVLLASAAHFAEGELACWGPAPAGRPRARAALRLLAAAVATVGLPAAVGTADRRPAEVGVTGALAPASRAVGDRRGARVLREEGLRGGVGLMTALATGATAALALTGDRQAARDTAQLTGLALLAPPSLAFAGYFGGWHALRHTARVVDALVDDGRMPDPQTLPRAVGVLGPAQRVGGRRRAAGGGRPGGARPGARQRQRLRRGAGPHRPAHDDGGAGPDAPRPLSRSPGRGGARSDPLGCHAPAVTRPVMTRSLARRPAAAALLAVALSAVLPLQAASAGATGKYRNCTEYNKAYPHGVGLRTAKDKTASTPVTTFRKDDAEFKRAMGNNRGLDRDKDSIACEKR